MELQVDARGEGCVLHERSRSDGAQVSVQQWMAEQTFHPPWSPHFFDLAIVMTFAAIDHHAMQAVIADAYKVFGRYKAPSAPLDACTHCCMSPEVELQMQKLPLRKLTHRHFYEYNTAANGDEQPAYELRYFLPRMLELIAQGEEIHHSTELFLDRVGRCPPGSFDATERAVLDRFALEYFTSHLAADRPLTDDSLTVLLMLHIGGLDLRPLLNYWLQCDDPPSTVQYVEAGYWGFWERRDASNAFAENREEFRQLIREWMLNPAHKMVFADKLMRPEFQALVDRQPDSGRMPFHLLVDAIFDNLIQ